MTSGAGITGYAFATNRVAKEKQAIKFMYRESPDGAKDSGWRFFTGEEPQEYVDDPANTSLYLLSTIAEIDPSIIPLLDTPAPCAFEREDDTAEFVESDFDQWPEE